MFCGWIKFFCIIFFRIGLLSCVNPFWRLFKTFPQKTMLCFFIYPQILLQSSIVLVIRLYFVHIIRRSEVSIIPFLTILTAKNDGDKAFFSPFKALVRYLLPAVHMTHKFVAYGFESKTLQRPYLQRWSPTTPFELCC